MNANCKVPAWKDRNGNVHLNHDEFLKAELEAIVHLDDPAYQREAVGAILSNRAEISGLLHEIKPRKARGPNKPKAVATPEATAAATTPQLL